MKRGSKGSQDGETDLEGNKYRKWKKKKYEEVKIEEWDEHFKRLLGRVACSVMKGK